MGASAATRSELVEQVRFGADGLVPAVVQDATSGRVLTLAWMSAASLERTLADGETWFWSVPRRLRHKGATSGHTQTVRAIRLDCDADALVVLVDQAGVACHTGQETCFHRPLAGEASEPFAALGVLERVIAERAAAGDADASYTARLLSKGDDTVGKKVGEEATEVAMALKGHERRRVVEESADLLYHLAVLWRAAGVRLEEVAAELAARRP